MILSACNTSAPPPSDPPPVAPVVAASPPPPAPAAPVVQEKPAVQPDIQRDEDVWTLLERGESDKARGFFLGKVDVHAVDSRGMTPLHWAAEIRDSKLATFFIAMGAEIDAVDKQGRTPLGISAEKHDAATAKVLVAAGADIHHAMPGATSPALIAITINGDFLSALMTADSIRGTDANGQTILDLALGLPDSKAHAEAAEQLILMGATSKSPLFSYFAPGVRSSNYNIRITDGITPLHFAASEGYTGFIAFLIEKNADVNVKNSSGTTPLHEAARSGNIEAIQLLLDKGAAINAQDAKGNSVLHIAMPPTVHQQALSLFLSRGANPNLKDEHGDSPLHIMIILNRDVSIVKTLLNSRASGGRADVSIRNIDGKTPLYLAIQENRDNYIPLLLEYKSDVFAADNAGITPFERALREQSPLLPALITPDTVLQNDSNGNTMLHITIKNRGNISIIERILDNRALINARNQEGDTGLHLTVRQNKRDTGELLLARGADIFAPNAKKESPLYLAFSAPGGLRRWMLNATTLQARDGLGNTVLHYAAQWKLNVFIPLIIEMGGNKEAANNTGETPLFMAVKYDSPSTIGTLLSTGAIISARDILGNTCLHAAVRWNAFRSAETLISSGLDINAHALNGKTPLHDAIRLGVPDLATLLIQHGAALEVRDANGNTPLMEAIAGGFPATAEWLVVVGANPTTRNARGDTPLHIAVALEQREFVLVLLNRGVSIHARNALGMTPFRIALGTSPQMVATLLTKDRIVTADDDGSSPLHIAIQDRASTAMVKVIINQGGGASVAAIDAAGRTPLRLAMDKDAWDLAKLLITAGSDIFSIAGDEKSPAEIALSKGEEAIRSVFDGETIKAQDRSGNTVLHYAAQTGNPQTISLLIQLGADKNIKNIAAESPADIAQRWKRNDAVALLN
ncbi:MAG: ankyrin repeat domain-containing protein [Treponema sp.]|nr:ankyrin repeat domain-containing protein [Treponema sp.]